MTNPTQTLFTLAVTHVRQQGEPAYETGTCLMLTDRGLQCAVGCLIPKDAISDEIETGANPAHLNSCATRQAIADAHPDLDLDPTDYQKPYWSMLAALQEAHDNAAEYDDGAFPQTFERFAKEVAEIYHLEMPS